MEIYTIESIKQLCRDKAPLINLFQYKENYKQWFIQSYWMKTEPSTKGNKVEKQKKYTPSRVSKSNESFVQNSSNLFGKEIDSIDEFFSTAPPSYSFRAKRCFAAFIPALAGLVYSSVES